MSRKFINLIGKKFGKLIVIDRAKNSEDGRRRWKCKCECGNITILQTNALRRGNTKSCGCLRKMKNEKNPNYKHGKRNTKLYYIWQGMKQRCYDTKSVKYHNYGKRGIKVCDEWKNDFMSFYNWALKNGFCEFKNRKEQTLDRINNNGNYEPNNCRWVTQSENCRNRNNNKILVKDGISKTIAEWCEELGLNQRTVSKRAQKYEDISDILSVNNLLRKKHQSNTGEFYITKKDNNKFILIIKHKFKGSFKSLEDAIKRREEILNGKNYK